MADPFVAEIRIFAGNFAPKGWALCNGQLLPLSQNTALFSLLGTYYGGNGKSNFALPDLQGNNAMGAGDGGGLTPRFLGEMGGLPTVTLNTNEMPGHNHTPIGSADNSVGSNSPTQHWLTQPAGRGNNLYNNTSPTPPLVGMNVQSTTITGNTFPHSNMQPYLVLTFIIAMQGVYPSRG